MLKIVYFKDSFDFLHISSQVCSSGFFLQICIEIISCLLSRTSIMFMYADLLTPIAVEGSF